MSRRSIRLRSRAGATFLAVVALTGLGGVAYALAVPANRSVGASRPAGSTAIRDALVHTPAPALSIRAQISEQTAVAGDTVAYRVRIRRAPRSITACGQAHPHVPARIWLGVARPLPARLTARFGTRSTLSPMATLTVHTSTSSRRGNYRLRINAHGALCDGSRYRTRWAATAVSLSLISPPYPALTIRGTPSGLLSPGRSASINLLLTNPYRWRLKLNRLVVTVTGVQAPRAGASHPCSVGDFAISQFSGSYGFSLPPRSTRSLRQLGFAAQRWPALSMLDPPVDQDGCQGASVSLSYSARATGESR